MTYAVLPKSAWDHTTEDLASCEGVTLVPLAKLSDVVSLLTGKGWLLLNANVQRKLRNGERVYIAPERYVGMGVGLLIQKVTP